MEIQRSTRDGCVIVAFAGTIDVVSVSMVQRALLKEFSEQPYALICDLAGVDHLDRICATVFATVANHPGRWPGTGFVLCGAQPQAAELLGRLRVPDFLPMHATIEQALEAVFARPPYLREELVLAPTLSAPAAARAFVRDTCLDWQLAHPEEPRLELAMLLASDPAQPTRQHPSANQHHRGGGQERGKREQSQIPNRPLQVEQRSGRPPASAWRGRIDRGWLPVWAPRREIGRKA